MPTKHPKTAMAIKRIALACILIFGPALAHSDSTGEVLRAAPEQFDFGTIPEGEPASTTAIIENVSGNPIEITNVRTS